MDTAVKKAIATITEHARTTIKYTDAVFDQSTGRWISRSEVAETNVTAFATQKADHVPGRLVVRRIPDFNADKHKADGQDTLTSRQRPTAPRSTIGTTATDALAERLTLVMSVTPQPAWRTPS